MPLLPDYSCDELRQLIKDYEAKVAQLDKDRADAQNEWDRTEKDLHDLHKKWMAAQDAKLAAQSALIAAKKASPDVTAAEEAAQAKFDAAEKAWQPVDKAYTAASKRFQNAVAKYNDVDEARRRARHSLDELR